MTSHVLVVDDNEAIREMIQQVLEVEGFRVSTAANGQEALEQIVEQPPAMVLLDLQMPVLDGWQTQARLREVRPELPVVFMTAGNRARVEAEKHHAAGYLAKPFNLVDLLDTVERFATAS